MPATVIRDEVDRKDNSMKQNSEQQILRSLTKDESKHFLNQWYIA